ncbi:MAG: EamA family transporter RarD [Alphaproteobacteria bacterium]|nr:MAG: EamA family transporter RarD [Alphaproteobacteria bacterium]
MSGESEKARPAPAAADEGDSPSGFAFALGAYLLWGILPLYMKAVAHIPPVEVVAHRVLWSVPVAGAVLVALGRTRELRAAITDRAMLGMAAVTAALISVNWSIYVWSIANDRALDAALAYYVNPLFSVFLGAVFLRERLSALQWAAIALAAAAVGVITWHAGQLPLAAIGIILSWGLYAFFKRKLAIGPNQGFLLEVLILSPAALAYILYLARNGAGHFLAGNARDDALLLAAGVVTAVPLMLYVNGARRLRLTTIAMLQYLTPTMIFLIAVLVFGEPVDPGRAIAFPMIWAALVLFTIALVRQARERGRARRAAAAAAPPR